MCESERVCVCVDESKSHRDREGQADRDRERDQQFSMCASKCMGKKKIIWSILQWIVLGGKSHKRGVKSCFMYTLQ